MESFLDKVASKTLSIAEDNNIAPDKIAVIFPTRRSVRFFKSALARQINKPVWMPDVISLPDYVANNGPFSIPDEFDLVKMLYQSYTSYLDAGDFIEFYAWGRIILRDFDELDRYLVPTENFFKVLYETRAMEEWEPGPDDPERFQDFWQGAAEREEEKKKKFAEFWQKLGDIYNHFTSELANRGQAYEGLAYRKLADEISVILSEQTYEHWIFAGFNALNPAEEKIINALYQGGRATVLWDADAWYVNNEEQEAGRFLRENLKKFKSENSQSIPSFLAESKKHINVFGAPGIGAMYPVLSRELSEAKTDAETNAIDTVVVLPDPSQAVPLMHYIPEQWEKVNFTMGVSFPQSQLASLIEVLEDLYNGMVIKAGERYFYHMDVEKFLTHPLTAGWFEGTGRFIASLKDENAVYVGEKQIQDKFSGSTPDFLLGFPSTAEQGVAYTRRMMNQILDPETERNKLEAGFISGLITIADRIGAAFEDKSLPEMDISRYWKLLREVSGNLKVPFEGEPLEGLQVMGLLETMTLDFKHVVMLGCNDNILPGNSSTVSIMPYDLKRAYGMPGRDEQSSITGYHFYRLIQRAERITFLYDNSAAGSDNEKSRFVRQLEYELPRVNPGISIKSTVFQSPPGLNEEMEIAPAANEQSRKVIDKLFYESGVAPTHLINYNLCPLQFYFQYILGLEEPDEVMEDLDAGDFGTIFHETMAALYRSKMQKELTINDLESLKKDAPDVLSEEFSKCGYQHNSGKTLLGFETLKFLLSDAIDIDKRNLPFVVTHVEEKLKRSVQLPGEDMPVKVRGIADRIDFNPKGGFYRLLDYKTGKVDTSQLSFVADHHDGINRNNRLAIQLLYYAWLFKDEAGDYPVSPSVLSLRNMTPGYLTLSWNGSKEVLDSNKLNQAGDILIQELQGLKSAELFAQTTDHQLCSWCAFRNFCIR